MSFFSFFNFIVLSCHFPFFNLCFLKGYYSSVIFKTKALKLFSRLRFFAKARLSFDETLSDGQWHSSKVHSFWFLFHLIISFVYQICLHIVSSLLITYSVCTTSTKPNTIIGLLVVCKCVFEKCIIWELKMYLVHYISIHYLKV